MPSILAGGRLNPALVAVLVRLRLFLGSGVVRLSLSFQSSSSPLVGTLGGLAGLAADGPCEAGNEVDSVVKNLCKQLGCR